MENVHDAVDGSFKAAVFGFSDGLTTSINLVLGVAFLGQSPNVVVLVGLTGLLAGASSMACGEWLSAYAEKEVQQQELKTEKTHLECIADEEARHMKGILMNCGLSAATADAVNRDVQALPIEQQVAFHAKFELGIDPEDLTQSPLKNAMFMWIYFTVGALVPIAPWLVIKDVQFAIGTSIALSVLALVGISLYQVRGRHHLFCWTFMRQTGVLALSVGCTVGLNLALQAYVY